MSLSCPVLSGNLEQIDCLCILSACCLLQLGPLAPISFVTTNFSSENKTLIRGGEAVLPRPSWCCQCSSSSSSSKEIQLPMHENKPNLAQSSCPMPNFISCKHKPIVLMVVLQRPSTFKNLTKIHN